MELCENTRLQLRAINEKAAARYAAKGAGELSIGDFCTSSLDEARLGQLGMPRWAPNS
jgi:hypothetical protein